MRNQIKAVDQQIVPPPTPAIRHHSDGARDAVIAVLRYQYDQAIAYNTEHGGEAVRLAAEVERLRGQLADAERRRDEAAGNARRGREIAEGWAAHLASEGVQVPVPGRAPYEANGFPEGPELSSDPAGILQRIDAAHNELEGGARS